MSRNEARRMSGREEGRSYREAERKYILVEFHIQSEWFSGYPYSGKLIPDSEITYQERKFHIAEFYIKASHWFYSGKTCNNNSFFYLDKEDKKDGQSSSGKLFYIK